MGARLGGWEMCKRDGRSERESTKPVRLREQVRWYRVLGPAILATTEKSKKNLKNIIDI